MGLIVTDNLSAFAYLKKEHIHIEKKSLASAAKKKIVKIAILNLMPNKQTTEVQLLRLLDHEPFLMDVVFVYASTHQSKNTSEAYIKQNYLPFNEIKNQKWDGLIITGAPVELLKFEEVDYWEELKVIMDWTLTNVTSTFFICWGAQAALYHFYQIPKYKLAEKMFGVFVHQVNCYSAIVKDFKNPFFAPHSRHTEVIQKDIEKMNNLKIISKSEEAGLYIVIDENRKQIFVTGHSEYDINTLQDEYLRDLKKNLPIKKPRNYFPDDNENIAPINSWETHAKQLFNNWLKYYIQPFYENK